VPLALGVARLEVADAGDGAGGNGGASEVVKMKPGA
jgi:hypothetical protein